jgi:hypothetical protein
MPRQRRTIAVLENDSDRQRRQYQDDGSYTAASSQGATGDYADAGCNQQSSIADTQQQQKSRRDKPHIA